MSQIEKGGRSEGRIRTDLSLGGDIEGRYIGFEDSIFLIGFLELRFQQISLQKRKLNDDEGNESRRRFAKTFDPTRSKKFDFKSEKWHSTSGEWRGGADLLREELDFLVAHLELLL